MADEGAWNQGWALGAGLAQEQRARKQALTDEERETHLGELGQNISSLQKKYSSLLGPKGEDTPESLKTKYALNQAMQQRDALLGPQKTPSVGGKIGEKIGEALHLAKKPEAQTVTTQPAALPATPSAPITSPELPAYKRGATAPTEPGVAATTLPAMEGGGARTACWKTDHCARSSSYSWPEESTGASESESVAGNKRTGCRSSATRKSSFGSNAQCERSRCDGRSTKRDSCRADQSSASTCRKCARKGHL